MSAKVLHRLPGVLVNHLKRVGAIRRTRVIAQVQVIVLRQLLANLLQDGQSAISAIEYTNFHAAKILLFSEIRK